MSLVHLIFKREYLDEYKALYLVHSFDFSNDHTWEPIARVSIDKASDKIEFSPEGRWVSDKVMPFEMAGNADLNTDFSSDSFFYGAWVSRIVSIANKIRLSGDYPEEY